MKKLKSILCIILAMVIVVTFCSCGNSKSEKVALKYVKAVFDGNAKTVAKYTLDDSIYEDAFPTKKLFENYVDEQCRSLEEKLAKQYGDDWKYSAKVIDSYEAKYLYYEDYNGYYHEYVEEFYGPMDDLIDAVVVAVKVTVKGKSGLLFFEKDVTDEKDFKIVTIYDDGWKVVDNFSEIYI